VEGTGEGGFDRRGGDRKSCGRRGAPGSEKAKGGLAGVRGKEIRRSYVLEGGPRVGENMSWRPPAPRRGKVGKGYYRPEKT